LQCPWCAQTMKLQLIGATGHSDRWLFVWASCHHSRSSSPAHNPCHGESKRRRADPLPTFDRYKSFMNRCHDRPEPFEVQPSHLSANMAASAWLWDSLENPQKDTSPMRDGTYTWFLCDALRAWAGGAIPPPPAAKPKKPKAAGGSRRSAKRPKT